MVNKGYKTGDKIKFMSYSHGGHKLKEIEAEILQSLNNKLLLVNVGNYKECVNIQDVIY